MPEAKLDVDPAYGIGTTEYMRSVGGYATTLECGQHEDPRALDIGYTAIVNTLAWIHTHSPEEIMAKMPEEIVGKLNEYFTRMVDIVFAHKGTLDKFVGDMVMALFGAPLDDADHAQHAVDAALAMIRELNRLNEKWTAEGRPALDIGIGISTGPMIAGNIGSSAIMSYTVIGDNVNLGSRLESLNKDYGTRIIISDATRTQLRGAHQLRPLGDVVVKGKTRAVAIFEVVVPSPIPAVHEDVQT